jgi:replicative DNA helicase
MTESSVFRSASAFFEHWQDNILKGKPPTIYKSGTGDLSRLEIGPERVTLLGGAPGSGKTALVMQLAVDALRTETDLRACVCSVEMSPEVLLERQLARLSGVPLTTIRRRELQPQHCASIDVALNTIKSLADRICFVSAPFTLDRVAQAVDATRSNLIVLDYIQRIHAPGKHESNRAAVNVSMDYLRRFAAAGKAVLVVAAVARTKDSRGRSSYDSTGLGLASFRESSEIEFGADDAHILVGQPEEGTVLIKHVKARFAEPGEFELAFDRRIQKFTSIGEAAKGESATQHIKLVEAVQRHGKGHKKPR